MYMLPCSKCRRQAAGMDAHGPIPAGTLMIHAFNPVVCVDCAANLGTRVEQEFELYHEVTGYTRTIKAFSGGDAFNRFISDLQIQQGKILDLDVVKIMVKQHRVRPRGDHAHEVPVLDALLSDMLRNQL